MKHEDLTGKKFGRLTVIKRVENDKYNHILYLCKCDCGKEKIIKGVSLKNGNTKSCGCLQKEKAKLTKNVIHGKSHDRIYIIYWGMKKRCYNKKEKNYYLYGGRGITICEEWLNSFENFYNWAINNGYKEGLTIDRINVNGNYEPNNCRWSDLFVQANNTRRNKYILFKGELRTLAEWCRILKINYNTAKSRLRYSWDIERILTNV